MSNQTKSLEAKAEKLAATLPPLLIESERIASTVYQGVHGRRHAGQGDEFWQYRHYSPGDSPRNIDWRRSARSDTSGDNSGIYIRQKERESAQSLWIWTGTGPGMNWSSQKTAVTKKHRASVLSLALAQLLLRGGEKVGLAGSGTPPSNSRKSIYSLTHQLDDPSRPIEELPKKHHLPQNSALVCFSDFLSPLEEQKKVFQNLANQKLKVWLVQILDPAEMNLPYTGRVNFQLPQTGEELLHSDVETIRASYMDRIREHNNDLSNILKKWGWQHLLHTTDNPPEATLMTLYQSISDRHSLFDSQTTKSDRTRGNPYA